MTDQAKPKCDFCDKEAVHFCSQAVSQACVDHVADADKVESNFYEAQEKWRQGT